MLINVNDIILTVQAAMLEGSGSGLTETEGMSVDNIGGMPAARDIVSAFDKLDEALEEFRDLIEKNGKRIKTIVTSMKETDKTLSS